MIPPDASESGLRKLRAFLAFKTPPAWDEKLAELQRNLKSKFGSGAFRWVKPEQIHITLRFFGWITTIEAEEVIALLPPICSAHSPFTLACESLGTFPNVSRPRVLWAGLKGDLETAAALQNQLNSATAPFGEPPEDRPFKPHLTLARLKHPDRTHIADLRQTIDRGFQIDEPWLVTDLLLMQSHLSPQGSTYETLASFRLG
jgi:2'-5' RNA ligase